MTDVRPNPDNRLGAAYTLVGELPPARDDLPLLLRVRVTNTGRAPWSNRGAYPVNLSYHWLDPKGHVVDFEGLRAIMPGPLRPGESVELELQVEPPPRPGRYLLALDMVEEGAGWFSVQGVPYATVPIEVAPGPRDAPKVCIINGNCVVNDALGNHVVNQIRFFRERGWQTLALVEHVDPRQPAEVRRFLARITPDDLRNGTDNPQRRRAVQHFRTADLYIFNYSTFYPLVEAIRLVDHGVVIFDYHGVTPPHLWDGPGREALVEGARRIDLVRYADYAIAHSGFTRGELLATGAIAPERVFQMGYAVPLERFVPGPKPAYLLARYGLRPEQPVLLYIGRMARNKRVDLLAQALPEVRAALPDAVLLLVGDISTPAYALTAAQVRQIAAASGVSEAVLFTGQIADAELPDHYRLADVFVTASEHEGFCIPAVEAMAAGVPVVGAHATALPETIGDAGLTFAPGDAAGLAARVVAIVSQRAQGAEAHETVASAQ
jgi:glycosyltransferase involved in cell wall biosynthesis